MRVAAHPRTISSPLIGWPGAGRAVLGSDWLAATRDSARCRIVIYFSARACAGLSGAVDICTPRGFPRAAGRPWNNAPAAGQRAAPALECSAKCALCVVSWRSGRCANRCSRCQFPRCGFPGATGFNTGRLFGGLCALVCGRRPGGTVATGQGSCRVVGPACESVRCALQICTVTLVSVCGHSVALLVFSLASAQDCPGVCEWAVGLPCWIAGRPLVYGVFGSSQQRLVVGQSGLLVINGAFGSCTDRVRAYYYAVWQSTIPYLCWVLQIRCFPLQELCCV